MAAIFSQTANMLTSTNIESNESVIPVYLGGLKTGDFLEFESAIPHLFNS